VHKQIKLKLYKCSAKPSEMVAHWVGRSKHRFYFSRLWTKVHIVMSKKLGCIVKTFAVNWKSCYCNLSFWLNKSGAKDPKIWNRNFCAHARTHHMENFSSPANDQLL